MSFVQNYTADLRVDLRHDIDKSVGKTDLRIDDFLAKSHQQIAQDLTDPRHWYSFGSRQDLRALLTGTSPMQKDVPSNSIPIGSNSHIKTNSSTCPRTKARGRYSYRNRLKPKREKRKSDKPSKTPEYSMPCPTPEQALEQSEAELDSERSHTADPTDETSHDIRVITSAPPRHLNSAHEKERIIDNCTVNTIQMREFLDGIISKEPPYHMDIGDSFVLPTISSVRSDFLPTTARSKYTQSKPDVCANNKPLPTIDTTRIEGGAGTEDLDQANPQVIEKHLTKSTTSKLMPAKSNPFKGRVLLSNPDSESGANVKTASSKNNNHLIVNWITTLKTQNRDSKNKDASSVPGKDQTSSMQKGNQYPPNVIHLKQPTIRIPNDMVVSPDQKQLRKRTLNPKLKLRKPALAPKDVVEPSDNLFKTHLATSELKLTIIQHEIDNLYNKDPVLRKAVNRFPDGRCETDIRPKQDNAADKRQQECVATEAQHREGVATELQHQEGVATELQHHEGVATELQYHYPAEDEHKEATQDSLDPDKACTPIPRAPSVISIAFPDDQGALQTTKTGNEFPFRPISSKYRVEDDKIVPKRVPRLSLQSASMDGIKDGKKLIANVLPLEVFSERKYQAIPNRSPSIRRRYVSDEKYNGSQKVSPRNVSDVTITFDTEYDRYARGHGARANKHASRDGKISPSQAFNKLGIRPSTNLSYSNEYSSTSQQDLVRCYSTLSERGYFADLDSEYSDQDKMDVFNT